MILIIRLLFVLSCGLFGYFFAGLPSLKMADLPASHYIGLTFGLLIGLFVISLDIYFKRFTVRNILATLIGLAFGLIVHRLYMSVLIYGNFSPETVNQIGLASAIIFSYLGVVTVLRGQDEVAVMIPFVKLDAKGSGEELILLDTSVIIDGRIADICETHFLPGKLILPRFVLKELQLISDSSDPLKRNRGRRGLDVLNRIKTNPNVQVKINEMDFPEFSTVDAKLVKMGQVLNAKVFTNDFNLNKVAELQGVKVLNINELANALKPIVMPGEVMEVKILKEGKEHDQGVAYLDDGTMVVVDNGRRRIGQTLNVTITSVLQTQAGRMIFAKPAEESERGDRADRGRERFQRPEPRPQERRPNPPAQTGNNPSNGVR
ncbi:MAG: TRAM domain-containing protein [Candidatus Omnitrophica bacterium]|nr:TRAM domain-containing protein [Candidatus Omnitrophota bacterium]